MKTAIKILRGTITVLLILVIAVNGWLAVQRLVLHKDPPDILGYSQLVVTSGSMEPSFSAGDVVIIKAEDQYEPGQVVTFRDSQGQLVTHRIIGTNQGQFITKGDGNNAEDQELLSPQMIVGRMVTFIPGVGSLLMLLSSPVGLVLMLILGILIIELPSIIGGIRRRGKGRHADDRA